jgi:hypothetical protein
LWNCGKELGKENIDEKPPNEAQGGKSIIENDKISKVWKKIEYN